MGRKTRERSEGGEMQSRGESLVVWSLSPVSRACCGEGQCGLRLRWSGVLWYAFGNWKENESSVKECD